MTYYLARMDEKSFPSLILIYSFKISAMDFSVSNSLILEELVGVTNRVSHDIELGHCTRNGRTLAFCLCFKFCTNCCLEKIPYPVDHLHAYYSYIKLSFCI